MENATLAQPRVSPKTDDNKIIENWQRFIKTELQTSKLYYLSCSAGHKSSYKFQNLVLLVVYHST